MAAEAPQQLGHGLGVVGCRRSARPRVDPASSSDRAGRGEEARGAAGPGVRRGREIRAGVGQDPRTGTSGPISSTGLRRRQGSRLDFGKQTGLSVGPWRDDDMLLKLTTKGQFVSQIGRRDQSGGNKDTKNVKSRVKSSSTAKTNEAFVADGYGNRRVIVFDADTGAFKRMWGGSATCRSSPPPRGQQAGAGTARADARADRVRRSSAYGARRSRCRTTVSSMSPTGTMSASRCSRSTASTSDNFHQPGGIAGRGGVVAGSAAAVPVHWRWRQLTDRDGQPQEPSGRGRVRDEGPTEPAPYRDRFQGQHLHRGARAGHPATAVQAGLSS